MILWILQTDRNKNERFENDNVCREASLLINCFFCEAAYSVAHESPLQDVAQQKQFAGLVLLKKKKRKEKSFRSC